MRRLLIVGASILQLPAILKAKEMGFCVAVADYNPNAIGISYADQFYNVSTIDEEGITRAAKEFGPDGIMTLATDMPMRAVARACAACGLKGIDYETSVRATDKGEMIRAFEAHNVMRPWYVIVKDAETIPDLVHKISYPCILKPVDNAGSRGVVLCHGEAELRAGYVYAQQESRSGAVIIEEFLQGPEFSVEIIVVDGVPHVLQITDKLTTGTPHFVEMGHTQPTAQSDDIQSQIRKVACAAVQAVGIHTGPAHVELILTRDGPKMVELGARMGGDCITTHLVPLSTGIDMIRATIDLACGDSPDITPKWNKGAAIRYFETNCGVLAGITGDETARRMPGIREVVFTKHPGDRVGEIQSSTDRVGLVIAQADTREEAVYCCERAIAAVNIQVEPFS
jgi:biotin carboxylase